MNRSHPLIRFERLPIVHGPLGRLDEFRPKLIQDVVDRTLEELTAQAEKSGQSVELSLGQALYGERQRLKRERTNYYTRARKKRDLQFWGRVQSGLLAPPALQDRKLLLENVLAHYGEEIAGHYNPRIYRFATDFVPLLFNWLLNAASVRRINPWKQTESLEQSLQIVGEIPMLQNLSRKGTILLVPTHQSNIDSILIGYVIYLMSLPPFAYGAGLNLFSNPLLAFFMSRLGAYTVDRQKSNLIYKQVLKNYSVRILKEGIHSIFFPGGGRCRSGAIESKLKLGLLGTGLEAQLENHLAGKENPKIFVVPMVMSYNFVLEASSLIEDYLSEAGKHRFIIMDDESWQPLKVMNFFWKLFSSKSGITVRIGKPLDVFGNFVDEQGQSIGPNGTTVDPVKWLTTRGELRLEPQRDREYTRELGNKLVDRYHRENTVLASHLVAFSFFEALRKQYRDLDLFRFLRISRAQRTLPFEDYLKIAEVFHRRCKEAADQGRLFLGDSLKISRTEDWVNEGVRNLGVLHDSEVVRVSDGVIWTGDMNLLYYYRNRLTGYGFENELLG